MKGDRVEAVVDTGQGGTQTFEIVATQSRPPDRGDHGAWRRGRLDRGTRAEPPTSR
jgi:hypothetical protein